MVFVLDARLANDTVALASLEICDVLLMNQAKFPWLILVPRVAGARELFELSEGDYAKVMHEVRQVSAALAAHTKADKMNIAALGNQVPQLHIHIIARFKNDAAWPNPVWGVERVEYKKDELDRVVGEIREAINMGPGLRRG